MSVTLVGGVTSDGSVEVREFSRKLLLNVHVHVYFQSFLKKKGLFQSITYLINDLY